MVKRCSPADKKVAVIKAKVTPDFAEHEGLRHAVAHGGVLYPVSKNVRGSSAAMEPNGGQWAPAGEG